MTRKAKKEEAVHPVLPATPPPPPPETRSEPRDEEQPRHRTILIVDRAEDILEQLYGEGPLGRGL